MDVLDLEDKSITEAEPTLLYQAEQDGDAMLLGFQIKLPKTDPVPFVQNDLLVHYPISIALEFDFELGGEGQRSLAELERKHLLLRREGQS